MIDPLPISVILPVHNGARFVADAIKSVLAEPVSELIIVDDASTDDTVKVVEECIAAPPSTHRLEMLSLMLSLLESKEQRGPGASRNAGLQECHFPWIAFIDADDVWMPGKTLKQWNALEQDEHAFAASLVDHCMDIGYEIPPTLRADKLGVIELPFPSNLLCHRSVFEYVGGFDPDLGCPDDVDWYNRALKLGVRQVTVPEVLVRKRVHDNNLSLHQGRDMQKQIAKALFRKVTPRMFPLW